MKVHALLPCRLNIGLIVGTPLCLLHTYYTEYCAMHDCLDYTVALCTMYWLACYQPCLDSLRYKHTVVIIL